ncbi:hypothetical protein [Mycolicibacterium stellerae]|uniref:hypothetical protein n=1 Tax=Mycolicibacterium stellerae TaxID=2358193 RepID=UPI000F0B4600|nr:hypothetical protein [Mycolicibacterium stellerae]
MAATTGGAMLRLSEIQSWDTEHLTAAAGWWDATASRWEDRLSEVVRHSYTPGGSIWEGAAATAAQERALADRTTVSATAHHLRATSAAARAGAEALASARQQTLAAVNAARAAGFHVGDDLSVSYDDDGTPASEAKRAQATSMARQIWHSAEQLAATDHRVAEQIKKSSDGVQSLDFGIGGGPPLTPVDGKGPHNADDVFKIVDPLPPGKRPHVRELPTSDQIRALYDWLTQNGAPAAPSTYNGVESVLDDGTRISLREESRSEGTTVDINFGDGRAPMKVHLPRDGEEPQPAPESGNPGFWETVGGIGVAILGGIGWVGQHAAHPFS